MSVLCRASGRLPSLSESEMDIREPIGEGEEEADEEAPSSDVHRGELLIICRLDPAAILMELRMLYCLAETLCTRQAW